MGSTAVAVPSRKSPSSGRRTNKPLVEKKRRARINGCLGQLKSLILSAMQTEGAQVSRLEKADILEMTVKYLRHVQCQQASSAAVTSEPEVAAKFSAGYTECATEVIRYMDQAKCVTSDVRTRLESHLVERLRDAVCTPAAGSSPSSTQNALSPQQQTATEQTTSFSSTVPPASVSTQATSAEGAAQGRTSASLAGVSATPTAPAPSTTTNTCVRSTISPASEDYARHYQTAVDLANMAAGVIVPMPSSDSANTIELSAAAVSASAPSSSSSSLSSTETVSSSRPHLTENPTRSKSISPAHTFQERERLRKRYNSSESILPQFSSHPNTIISTSTAPNTAAANSETYLRSLQRPLHIEIPETPTGYPCAAQVPNHGARHPRKEGPKPSTDVFNTNPSAINAGKVQLPPPSSPSSSPSPVPSSSSSSTTTIYSFQEDAPPTLLYAYNYNLPNNRPPAPHQDQGQVITNSPKLDYSLVVYQPDDTSCRVKNSTAATPVTTQTQTQSHTEKFHATFALDQRPRLNDATNFYCVLKSSHPPSQGQLQQPRTMQHPAAMNAPTTVCPPAGGRLQAPECSAERRDVNNNNNNYYYSRSGSEPFPCPNFAAPTASQCGELVLRKPAPYNNNNNNSSSCPQVPSDLTSYHDKLCLSGRNQNDNSIKPSTPAELSSNPSARFHGDSRSSLRAPVPHPPVPYSHTGSSGVGSTSTSSPNRHPSSPPPLDSRNQSGGAALLSSNKRTHRANFSSHNDTQAFHSLNGQPGPWKRRSPPPPHSPPAGSYHHHHQSSVPSSSQPLPDTPQPLESPRLALKKHLLFGQRSEVTRRHCNLSHSTPVDDSRPGSADDTEQPIIMASEHSRRSCYHNDSLHVSTAGEQCAMTERGGESHGLSFVSSAGVSSAKRPCLNTVTAQQRGPLTSYNRNGHADDALWRPW